MTRADVTQVLEKRDIPRHIAAQKYAAWRGGNFVALFGGLLCLMSFGLVALVIVVLKEIPGMWFIVFAMLGGGGGLVLIYLGAHAASGEAMEAAGKSGSRLAGAIAGVAAKIRGINST